MQEEEIKKYLSILKQSIEELTKRVEKLENQRSNKIKTEDRYENKWQQTKEKYILDENYYRNKPLTNDHKRKCNSTIG